jgi:hypothetical protein
MEDDVLLFFLEVGSSSFEDGIFEAVVVPSLLLLAMLEVFPWMMIPEDVPDLRFRFDEV